MSISEAMSRPLRAARRSSGKHAMQRGSAQLARAAVQQDTVQQETQPDKRHRPKHAAVLRQRDAA